MCNVEDAAHRLTIAETPAATAIIAPHRPNGNAPAHVRHGHNADSFSLAEVAPINKVIP